MQRIYMKKKIKNFNFQNLLNGSKVTIFPFYVQKKVLEWSGCMLAQTWLHGDEDDCQRPVQKLFPPDPKNSIVRGGGGAGLGN